MRKVQPDTALDARRALEPTLSQRQQFVRAQLVAFHAQYACWPTALELLRLVTSQQAYRHFDVNSIRPRLFELEEQGYVAHGVKRPCAVSGKRVYTWVATTPTPLRVEDLSQARQVEMFR